MAVFAVLTAGCRSITRSASGCSLDDHTIQFTLERPGQWRLDWDPPEDEAFPGLLMANRGGERIDGLTLSDRHGRALFAPGDNGSPVIWSIEAGEQMTLSIAPDADGNLRWIGMAFWDLPPVEAENLKAQAARNAQWRPGAGLSIAPGGWVEWTFSAPLPHEGASIAWMTSPAVARPDVWVRQPETAWARIPKPARSSGWMRPMEFGASVMGKRLFSLRISAPTGPATIFRQLCLERELGGPLPAFDIPELAPPLRLTLPPSGNANPNLLVRLSWPQLKDEAENEAAE